jgi:phosphopantothenoylcysteine decarboxylase/phosphopantothenate--cysteine ligase
MQCVVTAGPTYESLDKVRRMTNVSTGKLGTELANFLVSRGHEVEFLVGEQTSWPGERRAQKTQTFSTTNDLRDRLAAMSGPQVEAVFHVAAVSDFSFGRVWQRTTDGEPKEIRSGKFSTRDGTLLAELVPTPKIISSLRSWFPKARIVGWKFEVDGNREEAIRLAERQIAECLTDACVVNGPGYGTGLGLVKEGQPCIQLAETSELFEALEKLVRAAAQ